MIHCKHLFHKIKIYFHWTKSHISTWAWPVHMSYHIIFLFIRLLFHSSVLRIKSRTYWGWEKMAAISQTAFSSAFSWKKIYEFRSSLDLFPMFQSTIFQHRFRQWLGAVQATSHYRNQWWLVYWRIYASPGLNELRCIHISYRPMRQEACPDDLTQNSIASSELRGGLLRQFSPFRCFSSFSEL